jgi:hypothetical protein
MKKLLNALCILAKKMHGLFSKLGGKSKERLIKNNWESSVVYGILLRNILQNLIKTLPNKLNSKRFTISKGEKAKTIFRRSYQRKIIEIFFWVNAE